MTKNYCIHQWVAEICAYKALYEMQFKEQEQTA